MEEKVDFEEFLAKFWRESVSEKVIPNKFLDDNKDFVLEVSFDIYRMYEKSDNDISPILARLFESFYKNGKTHNLKF